jgi:hypothetical protein
MLQALSGLAVMAAGGLILTQINPGPEVLPVEQVSTGQWIAVAVSVALMVVGAVVTIRADRS